MARIVFWGVACAQPGEPVIGAFATWRNIPIDFARTDTPNTTAQATNRLAMTPNTEGGMFANNVEVELHAEKTGPTTSTYGPQWMEQGNSGGTMRAIAQGTDPAKPDGTNHTYMLLRQASGDQWDVLYDFNWVGSTTDQLKVPRGNSNRIDIGLEVMGPQHVTVPEIANRVQFMAENKTWYRADTANTAQVATLGVCGQDMPWVNPPRKYQPPYCFNTKLTDGSKFTQWNVSKPGPAPSPAPPSAATLAAPRPSVVPTAKTVNGVDQETLARCMANSPDSCLDSVPGLTDCIRTSRICNTAAAKPRTGLSAPARTAPAIEADIRKRAAESFGVREHDLHISPTGKEGIARLSSAPASAHSDQATWTVESSAETHGLERRGLTFRGFRATYSAATGQLLDACWGRMCEK
ncbi:hypothetical protein [Streptomyces sp. UNOC14_S4]|uniref:hypothetical protein n=1 Tax=Streptomyces sp. UNOC14_S4 TaxID=2872340 RepID=UPI001E61CED5|nr:hypothetical protein [Streptomyces sp. UNOC14_S4]